MTPALSLLLSLGLGLLIGLERGWRQREVAEGGRIAGIRTFALLGLGGAVAGLLANALSIWVAVTLTAAMAASLLLAHRARLGEADENVSATNVVVGLLTIALGLLVSLGFAKEATIAAGATTLLLSMREQLHGWVRSLSAQDVRAAAQYGAITLVMLPLLPDRTMGPYDALNPRMLWLVVVFVTGLSFAGYWAAKRFGAARGTLVAAAIGATYSSTAVTLDLARRLRDGSAGKTIPHAGIAAATAIMPARTIVLCAVVAPQVLGPYAMLVGPAMLCAAIYALVLARRATRSDDGCQISLSRNPFDFWPAVGFAVLVAAIVVASHWAIDRFGHLGATFVIGLTGFYDVDAAIIAASNLPAGTVGWDGLGVALALPVLTNNLVKLVMVLAVAGVRRGAVAAIPLALVSAMIGGSLVLL